MLILKMLAWLTHLVNPSYFWRDWCKGCFDCKGGKENATPPSAQAASMQVLSCLGNLPPSLTRLAWHWRGLTSGSVGSQVLLTLDIEEPGAPGSKP